MQQQAQRPSKTPVFPARTTEKPPSAAKNTLHFSAVLAQLSPASALVIVSA